MCRWAENEGKRKNQTLVEEGRGFRDDKGKVYRGNYFIRLYLATTFFLVIKEINCSDIRCESFRFLSKGITINIVSVETNFRGRKKKIEQSQHKRQNNPSKKKNK